ncbi:MAG: sugar transferase [Synergistaceae bacterium]|nr:sugar transferase [Synergistaceae bacterium]
MRNNATGNVHSVGASVGTLSQTLDVVKRIAIQILQIALDVLVYCACLELVLHLWASSQSAFPLECRLFFCGVIFVCFYFHALYGFRTWMFWDEMREVLKATSAALLIVVALLFAFKLQLSRLAIITSFILFVPSCLAVRYLFRRALFAHGLQRTPILVIGAGKTGELYAKKVARHPFMGCNIVGFLDDDPQKCGQRVADVPVLGVVSDFPNIQRELNVAEVVVAISTASRELLVQILETVEMKVKRVSYIPDMYMLTTFSASIRDVDGVPLISASQGLLNPMNRMMKSVMDYVGAIVALVVFSPVFLYVFWRIKRDDGGSVFFKQTRVGHNLAHFKMYKFRTMVPNAEPMLAKLLKDDEKRREYEVAFKFKDDPRITKAGHFLRRTSLDEIPQIFNVLKGEMSLIGPRPFVPQEIEQRYGDAADQIYAVKPGLTGLWQVSGRNNISDFQHSRDLDLYYIHNWSLWLDIVILFRTIQILLNADGAY